MSTIVEVEAPRLCVLCRTPALPFARHSRVMPWWTDLAAMLDLDMIAANEDNTIPRSWERPITVGERRHLDWMAGLELHADTDVTVRRARSRALTWTYPLPDGSRLTVVDHGWGVLA